MEVKKKGLGTGFFKTLFIADTKGEWLSQPYLCCPIYGWKKAICVNLDLIAYGFCVFVSKWDGRGMFQVKAEFYYRSPRELRKKGKSRK